MNYLRQKLALWTIFDNSLYELSSTGTCFMNYLRQELALWTIFDNSLYELSSTGTCFLNYLRQELALWTIFDRNLLYELSSTETCFIIRYFWVGFVLNDKDYFSLFCLIAIIRQLMKDTNLPYTVVLIILGVSFGAISRKYESVQAYVYFIHLPSSARVMDFPIDVLDVSVVSYT